MSFTCVHALDPWQKLQPVAREAALPAMHSPNSMLQHFVSEIAVDRNSVCANYKHGNLAARSYYFSLFYVYER
jgi:hypothetical protein